MIKLKSLLNLHETPDHDKILKAKDMEEDIRQMKMLQTKLLNDHNFGAMEGLINRCKEHLRDYKSTNKVK